MPNNITMAEILGTNGNGNDYAVDTNWRIDFSTSSEVMALFPDGAPKQMNYLVSAAIEGLPFSLTYASKTIKGITVKQAAWQTREIGQMRLTFLEPMDRSLQKAFLAATNGTAGMFADRNIRPKSAYTFSGVQLMELGNSPADGSEAEIVNTNFLYGCQILSGNLGRYNDGANGAGLVETTLTLYVNYWKSSEGDN